MPTTPAMVMLVMSADVRHTDPTHEWPQRFIRPRPQNQMPVIGHQTIGQQVNRISLKPLTEHFHEREEIFVLVEQLHSPIAAVENVVNQPRFIRSKCSWHAGRISDDHPKVEKSVMTPFSKRR